MIIVSIANQKGGEGKTTTSINLADGIARRNKRTLLIDMDPQANSTGIFLNSDQIEKSMYHVFNSFAPVKEIIHKTKVENLDIAPSELKLAEMETRSSNTVEAPYILKDALSNLNNEYDICIIDCPPSLSIFTINALVASNYIIIPLQAEKFSIDGIIGLQGTVDNIKKRINPQLQILGALITQLKPQTLLTKTIVPVIVKFFRLFDTTISDGVSVGESNMARSSVYTYNKKSKQAQEYENFTEEVLNELEK
ncbi:MAG: ParA family protein [Leptospiraceae bacterium]|nr:ParA family protein [Leptospiraceae bacterium]MCP5496730.1 ParA family protein [Leptospiraceae bacterium]